MNDLTTPRLVFRADGGSKIGLGHLMRCLAIAEMVGDLFKMSFAIQQPSEAIQQLLRQASFDIICLQETTNYEIDFQNFSQHLTGQEFIILDGYSFRANYQKQLKQHCRKLIAIDDLASWHQYADVVINHSGNARIIDYQAEGYTQFLIGSSYALLRKSFLETKRQDRINQLSKFQPQHILVNLGGADPENISQRVVESLIQDSSISQIVVILGAANPYGECFTAYPTDRVQIRRNLNPEQVVDAIENCHAAIVSCSTISYEVATVGKPFIGIITADNQAGLRDFYADNQIALAVIEKDFNPIDLSSKLALPVGVVNASLTSQQRFFDGRSGERIAAFFRTLLANH
ncbi:UDP-2,4-diacetamido-2,4,6-trideoxy-beta-L-altropyranose hydrolase [Spirosoma litoris]